MKRHRSLWWLAVFLPACALADDGLPVSLRAAKAPGGPSAWEQPAQMSYLDNTGGESSYAINSAFSALLPNVPGTPIQPQLTAWIAKNTLTAKKQDKRGLEAAVGMAGGDYQFGYVPQLSVSFDRDQVKRSDERTYKATVEFTSKTLSLGECGHSLDRGCTYWNLLAGYYLNDVRSADGNTGLGKLGGSRILVQLTSSPFPAGHVLAPLSLSASAQGQWDRTASGMRVKETRTNYVGTLAWRFYGNGARIKPSIALQRVLGSDLLAGQEHQAYTQLSLRLEI